MDRFVLMGPALTGEKVTLMVQGIPAATLVPQAFVCLNSAAPTVILVMVSVVFAVFVSITTWGELELPVRTCPKLRLSGTSFTVPTVSVIVALPDLVESDAKVPLSVTMALAGTVAGAV
jgi:hypothetical protein